MFFPFFRMNFKTLMFYFWNALQMTGENFGHVNQCWGLEIWTRKTNDWIVSNAVPLKPSQTCLCTQGDLLLPQNPPACSVIALSTSRHVLWSIVIPKSFTIDVKPTDFVCCPVICTSFSPRHLMFFLPQLGPWGRCSLRSRSICS